MSTTATPSAPAERSWSRPMLPRSTTEAHRAATPLELLFDLCFVVAVAQAGGRLHHALGENHLAQGVVGYGMVFFAIWWAWMNFTWFASAYDTDDVPYRLLTLLQMAGVLVYAAGVRNRTNENELRRIISDAGYLPAQRDTLYRSYILKLPPDAQKANGHVSAVGGACN